MSFKTLWLFVLSAYFNEENHAQMIVQSCVKNITVSGLSGTIPYPTGTNEFYITITVDSEPPKNSTKVTLYEAMTQAICFNFDTSLTTTTASYRPTGGKSIKFDIMGDGATYGRVFDLFPNPSNGSDRSSFSAESKSIDKGGTITYSLYHQISTENVYLKIANRNFNVYRRCFELNKLCIFEGGIQNPIYPTNCIDNTILKPLITLQPSLSSSSATPIDDILDKDDGTTWSAPSPPTSDDVPTGTDTKDCWAPYSQYIIINLAGMGISGIASISLGFTEDPSFNHSGDSVPTSKAPPRWITFAFDDTLSHLTDSTSDILTDQYWAVDLRDGSFGSDGAFVWTINPLYFQLDTNPQYNTFRMTQITKGFGLQYVQNTDLQYRSADPTSGWYTYTAAYINPDDINTIDNPDFQVKQLAEIACKDIFPTSSPVVNTAHRSDSYNNCWNYATDQVIECYDKTVAGDMPQELFYPPVGYLIDEVIWGFEGGTKQNMHYCVEGPPITALDDWSQCNVTTNRNELKICMDDATNCNVGTDAFFALPMGWECKLPATQPPTTDPTSDPTFDPTVDPTKNPTTPSPTSDPTSDPTTNPTFIPTTDPTIDPTTDPTIDPTLDPTTVPTLHPTTNPTFDPTYDPTSDPTIDPTLDPTTDPTIDPTSDPTVDPTHDPTTEPTTSIPSSSPTEIPSTAPTAPTKAPTKPQGQVDEGTTTALSGDGIAKDDNDNKGETLPLPLHWIIIGICVAVCCCGLLVGFICYKRKNKQEEKKDLQDQSLAEVISEADVATAGDEATLQMVVTKKKNAEPSDSGTAGYYEKANPDKNTDDDDDNAEDAEDHENDDIYAKGRRTVSGDIDRNDSDQVVLAEHEGQLENLKMTEKGAAVLAKKASLEGGDPAVTGVAGVVDRTRGRSSIKEKAVESSSDEESADDNDGAALYGKGKRGKSRGGPKKEESDSNDNDDENQKLYGKGKRGKSRGGKRKNVEEDSDSDSDADKMHDKQKGDKAKKKVYKEEAGVVYGDPVVTAMQNAEGDSSEEEPVLEDEFDENEQYQM